LHTVTIRPNILFLRIVTNIHRRYEENMDYLDFLRGQARIAKTGEERVTERYSRIVIDLGTAREEVKIHLTGDYMGIAKSNGAAATTFFRLNHRNARAIYPSEIAKLYATYKHIYLTNAAEAGKELILYVGGALSGEIQVSTGKMGLKDSDGGDIDPVEDKHFISHTGGHLSNTIVADTAERLSATSLKVRWAIMNADLAIRWGFTSTVHRTGTIGVLLAAGATLTLEFCDLYDIYVINNAGAETPKIECEYVLEA
jgi:hypothetical protein